VLVLWRTRSSSIRLAVTSGYGLIARRWRSELPALTWMSARVSREGSNCNCESPVLPFRPYSVQVVLQYASYISMSMCLCKSKAMYQTKTMNEFH
jgi:hypothetical protein